LVKKSDPGETRGRQREGAATRARMVTAGLETLKEAGYAGASARTIAKRGGFNPALIFYHFGGVDHLLLAALDASSGERLRRYRELLERADVDEQLIADAAALFREDVEGGHVTVVTELIGASLSRPELRREVVARMQPWLELTEAAVARVLERSPLAGAVPAAPPAFAIVSLYLGLNLLSRLEPDLSRAEELFAFAAQLAALSGG
jgi:AcrR family transcriptional regulator